MDSPVENASQDSSITITQQKIFVGPVPSPEVLERYNQVNPGFAERLISMAEGEQKNRFEKQAKELELARKELSLSYFALFFALFSVALIVGLCAYGFHLGFAAEVRWIAVSVIATTVIAFLSTRYFQDKKQQ